MEIQGAVAIVTGGASGLGAAAARELSRRGARVGLLDLDERKGTEFARELDHATFVGANVANEEEMGAAVADVEERLGPVRILVSCAGIPSATRTVDREGHPFPLEAFRRVIDVHLVGTFNAIRLVAARMMQGEPNAGGERGVIVNTASVAAFEGQIGQAAYSAAKSGIVGMTLPIARDLAHAGIRCNTIAPGVFATPLVQLAPQEMRDRMLSHAAFPRRMGDPSEFGRLVFHVVENAMINGETLRIDGAARMGAR